VAQETWTKEQFWSELEAVGEDEVRTRLAAKIYGEANHKAPLAREWLRRKDQERSDLSTSEQTRIARSAKNAAWAAAIAAIIAAIFAVMSFLLNQ
jgi:hypothetical protein